MSKRRRATTTKTKITTTTKTMTKANPPTVIYDATRGIVIQGMQKGRGPFKGQVFRHRFKEPIEIIGLANGDVLMRSKKR